MVSCRVSSLIKLKFKTNKKLSVTEIIEVELGRWATYCCSVQMVLWTTDSKCKIKKEVKSVIQIWTGDVQLKIITFSPRWC